MIRRTIAAIINPVSGRRDMARGITAIECEVRARGARFLQHRTTCAGEATDIAASLDEGVEAVLAVGGDGTVCEVANGLVERNMPLAVLRTGTENLLARELAMPVDPEPMADLLVYGDPRPHDVGVMNGRKFLAVAGVGFDGLCIHRMTEVRTGHITHLNYVGPVWRSFMEYDFPELRVVADGVDVFCDRGFAMLGIIPRYSIGLRILERADPSDGLLDVCLFRCRSKLELLAHIMRVFESRHVEHQDVIYLQARSIRFGCDRPVPIQIDGEPGGFAPAEFSVLPSAASVLVPSATGG